MKKILLQIAISALLVSLANGVVMAANDKPKNKSQSNTSQGGNSNTPGNSNNHGGQGGGPGNSNNPNQGSPISGQNGNQGHGPNQDKGNAGGPKKIPLDGGLSLLLAAGVGLGAKKFFFDKKQENA